MVGYDPRKSQLTSSHYAVAGTMSGFASRIVVQPLDVVKIRLQLQVEPLLAPTAKYHSVLQATGRIIREEGTQALWKGHATAQIQAISFSLVQFAAFEVLTQHLSELLNGHRVSAASTVSAVNLRATPEAHLSPVAHFVCGAGAGCLAALSSQPFDVLRTRFIAQGEPRVYRGMVHASELMISQEGVRSFFRGMTPTLMLMGPQTGLQFGFYAMLNSLVNSASAIGSAGHSEAKDRVVSPLQSVFSGGLAGMAAKACVYPLDMCKRRLQVQGFDAARISFGKVHHCIGISDCMKSIVREEGAMALFKGLRPSLVKAALSVGVRFATYEQVLNFVRFVISPDGNPTSL